MRTKNFIVPHDFTDVADIALEHAIATAKPLGAEIYLLHVVSKQKEISPAETKLNEIIETLKTEELWFRALVLNRCTVMDSADFPILNRNNADLYLECVK